MRFEKVHDFALIDRWLQAEHVTPHFYGQGLQNIYDDLEKFLAGDKSLYTHWIAYEGEVPYAYLMTSKVASQNDPPWSEHISHKGKGITLDFLIGEPDFLGKGLASKTIRAFLKERKGEATDVFIDPEQGNARAVHVYKKAGFTIVGEYLPDWDPIPHFLMQLKMETFK